MRRLLLDVELVEGSLRSGCNLRPRRTLAIEVLLAGLSIRRMRLVVRVHVARAILGHGLLSDVGRGGCRVLRGLISYGGQLHGSTGIPRRRRSVGGLGITAAILGGVCCRGPLALLFGLALSFLLLLSLLPFFANLLELWMKTSCQPLLLHRAYSKTRHSIETDVCVRIEVKPRDSTLDLDPQNLETQELHHSNAGERANKGLSEIGEQKPFATIITYLRGFAFVHETAW